MHDIKLATCCYCGTRTALRLTARGGHELACGQCGAPLHEMKPLKEKYSKSAKRSRPDPDPHIRHVARDARKRKKKTKSLWRKGFKEVFDFVEDILD